MDPNQNNTYQTSAYSLTPVVNANYNNYAHSGNSTHTAVAGNTGNAAGTAVAGAVYGSSYPMNNATSSTNNNNVPNQYYGQPGQIIMTTAQQMHQNQQQQQQQQQQQHYMQNNGVTTPMDTTANNNVYNNTTVMYTNNNSNPQSQTLNQTTAINNQIPIGETHGNNAPDNNNNNKNNNKPSSTKSKPPSASTSLAHAILPDLPFLMHGSGDTLPQNVDPSSVAILAKCIEGYVSQLVSAAMDAQDVFTDGEVVGGGGCLPVPPYGSKADGGVYYGGGSKSGSNNFNYNNEAEEEDEDEENLALIHEIYSLDDEALTKAKTTRSNTHENSIESTPPPRKRRAKRKLEKLLKKKQQRTTAPNQVDYWDEPLPPPKEDESSSSNSDDDSDDDSEDDSEEEDSDGDDSDSDDSDDAPLLASASRGAGASSTGGGASGNGNKSKYSRSLSHSSSLSLLMGSNNDDDDNNSINSSADLYTSAWQGILPLDIHSNERTRNYYVTAPTAMDARSFIFPICHDATLYQRVKELQAKRREIGREFMEGQRVLEMVREEGEREARMGVVDVWDAVFGEDGGIDSRVGREGSSGLGLGSSAKNGEKNEKDGDKKSSGSGNNTKKGSEKEGDKSKITDGDKSKEEKKAKSGSDKDDWKRIVGAGLLDTSKVNPSWPGLEALTRGNMW